MKSTIACAYIIGILLLLSGCDNGPLVAHDETWIVDRTASTVNTETTGNPAAGAIVGSMIGGTLGAAIGASSASTETTTKAICLITVRNDQKEKFIGQFAGPCPVTAGDKMRVTYKYCETCKDKYRWPIRGYVSTTSFYIHLE